METLGNVTGSIQMPVTFRQVVIMKRICLSGLFALALLGLVCNTVSAAAVTQNITYQGVLTDAGGNPLSGTYPMTFQLYDVASGGAALATSANPSVVCLNGTFTSPVVFDSMYFDGQALWVGVSVGADPEMVPRQEIRPEPYALSLRPGAVINGTAFGAGYAFTLKNAGYHRGGLLIETNSTEGNGVDISTEGDSNGGVTVDTQGIASVGVDVTTYRNNSMGVATRTYGTGSNGLDIGTYGDNCDGVYAFTHGLNSPAIFGRSNQYFGIFAVGKEGGYFTTNQGGTNWWTDRRPAVNISTEYDYNPGITVNTSGYTCPGVYSETHGDNSQGFVTGTYGNNAPGVYASAAGIGSYGIEVHSAKSNAIYADTGNTNHQWALYTDDYIYAGGIHAPAVDLAEYMPVSGDVSPGTVLIIGPEGKLLISATANDTRVAGIVSTAPGVTLGINATGNPGEGLIAISGRVPCKVDARYGPIHPGDLLSTSATPGYAMKAVPVRIDGIEFYRDGTVLGKAMGTLKSGTGTIEVLVTLQ